MPAGKHPTKLFTFFINDSVLLLDTYETRYPLRRRTLYHRQQHNAAIPSVTGLLRSMYPSIFIIHRLDKDTSGILCFAKDEETHRYTSQLFEHRQVKKNYIGIVHGSMANESGTIEDAIMEHPVIKGKMIIHQKQGKPSITKFEVMESFGLYTFVKFDILTGRTHQIRVHMQNYGHPIVCDEVYGKVDPVFISQLKKKFKLSKEEEEEKPILQRLAFAKRYERHVKAMQKVVEKINFQ